MNAKHLKTTYERCLDYANDALKYGDSRGMHEWLNVAIAYLDRRYIDSDAPAGCVLDYCYLHSAPVLRVYDVHEGGYLDVYAVDKRELATMGRRHPDGCAILYYVNAVAEANRLIRIVVDNTPYDMLACWGEPDDETNTQGVEYVYASEVLR